MGTENIFEKMYREKEDTWVTYDNYEKAIKVSEISPIYHPEHMAKLAEK